MTLANVKPRLSIKEQAEYLDTLLTMCCWRHGIENVRPVSLLLHEADVEVLHELVARLKRMAPHEREIRRIVVGR